ncbi:putative NRPS-like enzyme [Aspergillus novofumigatus IBT 16806]|uniref:Putative NRPS-like enzyme n=1 Tax=Aspergillus novofumigatus (strain IBT 16806) TaxID=1392255 RepID=A0A2I1BXF7_ASPN1|nr:putative NRPS-like enzyme [Aspergillus novofumigatus IBT 16806]PKX90060.1 putative NRPS-like enzyme [Aspergillus novofumigatus IBT 16806]
MESPLVSPRDGNHFRSFGFGPQRPVPYPTVHHAFKDRAKQYPDAVAVCDLSQNKSVEVTYDNLLRYAQFIALRLQNHGVVPGSRIVLVTKRSVEMVAGILGILMCGAQYIPLDGAVVPDQTLEHAVIQSQNTVALCTGTFRSRLHPFPQLSSVLVLEELLAEAELTGFRVDTTRLICEGDESSGCYVIYTSGTTGDPKGVDVTHRNVTNVVCHAPGNLGMSRGSRVGQVLSISFDMGAWEILGSLCNGATLVLRGSDWHAALQQIDTLICTPSILRRYRPQDFPNIRCIATAGEPCSQSLADKWVANGATFYNCCGPTEITIINTMHRHKFAQQLTIGRPLPNTSVYILDDKQLPVAIGEVGTMWAGGAGITRGYLGQPEKTAERYRYDPFVDDGHSMMFNTGDLARWLPDGNLETLGRNDDQVKIKGFRVELDGVSASLASFPGVMEAAAIMVEGDLIAFVTPQAVDSQEIQAHLKARLPYYAIPTQVHRMDAFPLTPNGKIDKRALAQLCRPQRKSSQCVTEILDEKKHVVLSSSRETVSTRSDSSESLHKPVPLAEKKNRKVVRGLRYRVFIVYRRLFTLIWMANIAALLCVLFVPKIGPQWISTIAFINLTIAVLVRQDAVINILYTICCSVPKSWPLAIRRRCAKIYHLGGVHSGAAMAATAWFAGSIGYNIYNQVDDARVLAKVSPATLTLSLIVLLLLFAMIGFAYPTFRKQRHNTFERIHRFFGWTILGIIWIQTILSIRDQRGAQSLGRAVISSPKFWMLLVITASIASSWIFLRKVPVDAEVLSNHAVRLHFDYTMPVNGTFTRLSERPLFEWHSFATVPAPTAVNGRPKGYSLVVSRAGDWTGRQISKPPTHFWVRDIPTCGVMRIATLFNRVVLVGTGSGIGPLLGHIQVPTCPFRLVWSTPNPIDTFGKDVVDAVYAADHGAIVHDTKKQGRPDLVRLTWDAVQEFQAEAVIVISNEKLTKKVVYGMETRGVPAYGAIWDS